MAWKYCPHCGEALPSEPTADELRRGGVKLDPFKGETKRAETRRFEWPRGIAPPNHWPSTPWIDWGGGRGGVYS